MTACPPIALAGARIVTPGGIRDDAALLIAGGRIDSVVPIDAVPARTETIMLDGGWLLPGFLDTQVNGGGDVLLNDRPTVDGIRTIAVAHRRFGTTGMLPTLISDDLAVIDAAITATDQAIAQRIPGVLGLHIEGPFLNPDKRGIHDATKFRTLSPDAIALLTRPGRGVRLVTIAPELAPPGAIRALVEAGVVVAGGHSMADYDQTRAALEEGLHGFTHLFNAMTQFGSRDPGMVGAALEDRRAKFGIIVDGHHVHPAALRVALAARGSDAAMLVTDAMPTVGGVRDRFTLMGREISVIDGVPRGADGTLAGSALTMAQALRGAIDLLGVPFPEASRMASGNPAAFLGLADRTGAIIPGLAADLVHLDADRRVSSTWIAGARYREGEHKSSHGAGI